MSCSCASVIPIYPFSQAEWLQDLIIYSEIYSTWTLQILLCQNSHDLFLMLHYRPDSFIPPWTSPRSLQLNSQSKWQARTLQHFWQRYAHIELTSNKTPAEFSKTNILIWEHQHCSFQSKMLKQNMSAFQHVILENDKIPAVPREWKLWFTV